MSASDTAKTNDIAIEPNINQQPTEQNTEQRQRMETNASSVEEIEYKFDSLATQLKQISNESNCVLSTMDTLTSSASISIEGMSTKVNDLLSLLNTVKTEMQDKNMIPPSSNNLNLTSTNSSDTYPYSRSYLDTLSKSELIDIITNNDTHDIHDIHNMPDVNVPSLHHYPKSVKHINNYNHEHKKKKRARSDMLLMKRKKKHRHPHEKTVKGIKATERMATNYELIEKQRAAIKSLKKKRAASKHDKSDKCMHHNQKSDKYMHDLFMDPHEKTVTGIKATERMATNYEYIEKQRTRIRALKEERKLEKSKNQNSIQRRRIKAQQRMLGLFNHAHETKYNYNSKYMKKRKLLLNNNKLTISNSNNKEKKHSCLVLKRVSNVNYNNKKTISKGKVRVLRDDEVLRFSQEIPIENFMSALNSGFVKIMDEEEQNEQYLSVMESAKSLMEADLCNYQYVVTDKHNEWMEEDDSDTDSDWDQYMKDEEDEEDEEEEEHKHESHHQFEINEEELKKELLLLNLKTLKKRCKERRLSCEGGKLQLIHKIIRKINEDDVND